MNFLFFSAHLADQTNRHLHFTLKGVSLHHREVFSMNEKAKKYVTMFRQVKIASAATVDAG